MKKQCICQTAITNLLKIEGKGSRLIQQLLLYGLFLVAVVPALSQKKGSSGSLMVTLRNGKSQEISFEKGATISRLSCDSMMINSKWYSGIALIIPNPCDTVPAVSVESVVRVMPEVMEMNIYPNPTSGRVAIVINSPISAPVTIQVYDVLGVMVYQIITDVSNTAPANILWDIKNQASGTLPTGVYFVRATTSQSVATHAIHYFE